MVGVDASASARDAAEWGADLAAAWNAPLHLVQVVLGWPDDAPVPRLPDWLRELVDAAERCGVDEVEADVVPGGIVDTLLDRAAGARMQELFRTADLTATEWLLAAAAGAVVIPVVSAERAWRRDEFRRRRPSI